MQETNDFNIGEKIKTAIDSIDTTNLTHIFGDHIHLYPQKAKKQGPDLPAPIARHAKGNLSGALWVTGAVFTLCVAGMLAIFGLAVSHFMLGPTIAAIVVFAAGVWMGVMGGRRFGYAKRFRRYCDLLNGRAVITLSEIETTIGKSHDFVESDLRQMIADGLFPQGNISDDGEVFALSPEAAAWYAEKQAKAEAEKVRRAARLAEEQQNPTIRDARLAAEKGLKQFADIQAVERTIQDEKVRDAFMQLEIVTERILRFEQSHHERLNDLKRFNNYYLPTTVKLAKVYAALEKQPDSPNVRQSKREIVDALGDIETAFGHILDNLINDVRMDVSADISVMKTMFAQDGLNDDPFAPDNAHDKKA